MAEHSPKKRIVKNPETFRERAVKATSEVPKKNKGWLGRALAWPFKALAKGVRRLYNSPPVKPFKPTLRFLAKILGLVYLANSWKELKLVTWPSLKQSRQLTFAVLAFAIVFGAAIAVVDYGFDKLFKHILLK